MFQISEESKARHVKHRVQNDAPQTPELTDGETVGESSVAGDDGSDDEFPDAAAAADQGDTHDEDEDDEFPDAGQNATEQTDDEFPDVQASGSKHDRTDYEEETYQSSNPLQSSGPKISRDGAGHESNDEFPFNLR